MKKTLRKLIAAGTIGLGLASLLPMRANAQDVSVNSTIRDKYVLAIGIPLEEKPVVQSFVTASKNGFYGTLWSNFSTSHGISEVDYIAGYRNRALGLNFDVAFNIFDLKNAGKDKLNDNIYDLSFIISRPGKISSSLSLEQNLSAGTFNHTKGNYAILSLNHKRKVRKVPISVTGGVLYNNKYFSPDRRFGIAQVDVSLPLNVNGVSVSPVIRRRWTLDKKNFENSTDMGVSLGYNFKGNQ